MNMFHSRWDRGEPDHSYRLKLPSQPQSLARAFWESLWLRYACCTAIFSVDEPSIHGFSRAHNYPIFEHAILDMRMFRCRTATPSVEEQLRNFGKAGFFLANLDCIS